MRSWREKEIKENSKKSETGVYSHISVSVSLSHSISFPDKNDEPVDKEGKDKKRKENIFNFWKVGTETKNISLKHPASLV